MDKVYCKGCKKLYYIGLDLNVEHRYQSGGYAGYRDPMCLHDFEIMSTPSVTKPGEYHEIVGQHPVKKNKKLDCPDFDPTFWVLVKMYLKEIFKFKGL